MGGAQLTPPRMASTRMSANTRETNAASARYARAWMRDFRDFMSCRLATMTRPEGSPLRVIHRIRSLRGDAGCNTELMVVGSVVVVVPIVNQPITWGEN